MLTLEEAQARIATAIGPAPSEQVPLRAAAGRVLSEDILSPISLPPFDNSAMDGYALRAADLALAAPGTPPRLKRIGSTPAGASSSGAIESGSCIRIFTGSPLPRGADAVVMQEDTRVTGEWVEVIENVKPWENVRFAGEDVKKGTVVVRAGDRINAARIALLSALGIGRVNTARRPLVGILGTGNELMEAGQSLAPGQIYESNRATIASLVAQAGGDARVFPLVRDTQEATQRALHTAFAECDLVITTGGVSVGEHDYVKAAFEAFGGALEFWKVNVKPGKPFVFGTHGTKLLFGLPGNPVSAFVTFLLLVRPAILKAQGARECGLITHPAMLEESIHNAGDRRHFIRVIVDAAGNVRSAGAQASHLLNSLAGANALLDVPADVSWPAGRQVQVLRWEF